MVKPNFDQIFLNIAYAILDPTPKAQNSYF